MTVFEHDRMKMLLNVMVRRHTRTAAASHPVGQFIAREARRLEPAPETPRPNQANDADPQLVERLYRRLLLPRHSTVEAFADDSVTLEEALT